MGISGYAVVIIVMEAYNFTLSLLRLKSKVKFSFSVIRSLVLPFFAAVCSALLTKKLFILTGSGESAYWLVMKIIFTACAYFVMLKISLSLDMVRERVRA